jgi:hypothetical protein
LKSAIRRGVSNGLLISFWVLAFALAPRVGTTVYYWLDPCVNFNMH